MPVLDEDRINMLSGMVQQAAQAKKARKKRIAAELGETEPEEEGETTPTGMSQGDFTQGRKKGDMPAATPEDKARKAEAFARLLRNRK
jgi:hypothetical protein